MEIVNSSKVLQAETRMLLDGKLLVRTVGSDRPGSGTSHRETVGGR